MVRSVLSLPREFFSSVTLTKHKKYLNNALIINLIQGKIRNNFLDIFRSSAFLVRGLWVILNSSIDRDLIIQ